jgi:hypothetical protein
MIEMIRAGEGRLTPSFDIHDLLFGRCAEMVRIQYGAILVAEQAAEVRQHSR